MSDLKYPKPATRTLLHHILHGLCMNNNCTSVSCDECAFDGRNFDRVDLTKIVAYIKDFTDE